MKCAPISLCIGRIYFYPYSVVFDWAQQAGSEVISTDNSHRAVCGERTIILPPLPLLLRHFTVDILIA
ncbi:MAG: hypothetical protein FWG61_00880 [Firmicutes bacterium]|nr:hypothetical protein [Bacillota bacterium]